MNTNSYFTAAVATATIDARIREAENSRLVSEVRRTPGAARSSHPEPRRGSVLRRWFARPATA